MKIVSAPIVRAIPVSKDCMILSYIAEWAHGNVDNIGIANNQGGVRTLIDWSEIAPDLASAPDRRFVLALYSRTTNSNPPAGPIHAFAISEEWPELTSWKTQPSYDLDPAATYQFEPEPGWKLFDVTPIVRQQAKSGHKGHGVLLRFLSEDFAERARTGPATHSSVVKGPVSGLNVAPCSWSWRDRRRSRPEARRRRRPGPNRPPRRIQTGRQ